MTTKLRSFHRPWTIRSTVILASVVFFAQTEVPATQPAVKSAEALAAIKACDLAEAKAKADYERAITAARATAVRDLEAAMTKATRAGNLDEAIAIRETIKSVKAGMPSSATAETQPKAATGATIARAVLGAWDEVHVGYGDWRARLDMKANGTFHLKSNYSDTSGTWKVDDQQQVVLTWPTGYVCTYTLDDGVLNGLSNKGEKLRGVRPEVTKKEIPSP